MILIIISVLVVFIGIIIRGRFTYAENKNGESKIPKLRDSYLSDSFYWVISFMGGGITFLFMLLISSVITYSSISLNKVETELVEISSTKIYALQDNQFIGRNYTTNGSSYYVTLQEVDKKGKQLKNYNTSESYINYISSDEQSYVKEVREKIKNITWYMLPVSSNSEYMFYIPEGSIVEEYNVDLQ